MKKKLVLAACLIGGCVANEPFRSLETTDCTQQETTSCGNGFYERHRNYDIGFVEYSERGNDFFPDRTQALLDKISTFAQADGVTTVVFVHGWRHNAAPDDTNVMSFKKALDNLARLNVVAGKKVVGVYIGWRGMSLHGLGSENLTYWDRKATAEQVGKGGVTQLLLNLERIDRQNNDNTHQSKNIMLTIGHSFGGAVVLSALNEVLMGRMVAAQYNIGTQSFGNGVILLNPAIEADKGLLLKENSLKIGQRKINSPSLLYVISSQGDTATTTPFKVGQFLGTSLKWSQVDLKRRYNNVDYTLKESEMDTTTVGNYAPFWTGAIEDATSAPADKIQLPAGKQVASLGPTALGRWVFQSFCDAPSAQDHPGQLPCYAGDPMDVLRVPASFIKDHNDVFNDNVISLISTVTSKSIEQARLHDSTTALGANPACVTKEVFDFGKCFNHFYEKSAALQKQ